MLWEQHRQRADVPLVGDLFQVTGALYVAITLLARRCWSVPRPHAVPRAHAHRVTLGKPARPDAELLHILQRRVPARRHANDAAAVGAGLRHRPRRRLRACCGPAHARCGFGTLRVVAILFVELFRRIPFLVTLFFTFYATQIAGFDASLFSIATISVCVIATAYLSEIVRALAWIPCTRTSGTALRSPTSR